MCEREASNATPHAHDTSGGAKFHETDRVASQAGERVKLFVCGA